MPIEPTQIFPNDLVAHRAIGIRLPLSSSGVFGSTFTTQEATKYNLLNYLLTNPGEIPGNPTFGAGLRQFVFNQITGEGLDGIEDRINDGVRENIANVEIDQVTVLRSEDQNRIRINISYSIPGTGMDDEVEITF